MFGYVLPRRDKLSPAARDSYQAAYCGLCGALRRRYGVRARFLVNYDMTFFYLLVQDKALQSEKCRCPARPFCRRACLPDCEQMALAADLSVLLSYWKLCDARRDGTHRLAAAFALRFYRRCYRKAAQRLPALDRTFAERLARLQALEDAHCASLDRAADAFAGLLAACAELTREEQRRPMRLLLYHVGRYLYLADALEDLPKDLKHGAYNPLQYRFRPENGALRSEDKQTLLDTAEASISLAASALELLPPSENDELRRNIIYYGLPAVLHSVADGTFRKRKKHTAPPARKEPTE